MEVDFVGISGANFLSFLQETRLSVMEIISEKNNFHQEKIKIELTPSLVLAHRYYGSVDSEDMLFVGNEIDNPCFISGDIILWKAHV